MTGNDQDRPPRRPFQKRPDRPARPFGPGGSSGPRGPGSPIRPDRPHSTTRYRGGDRKDSREREAPFVKPSGRKKVHDYFATCTLGLEEVLAAELRAIGAEDVVGKRGGVRFQGDLKMGWRANLELRCATRVQELVTEFEVTDEQTLYDGVRRIDWREFMAVEQTLAVDATVRDSALKHSGFVALKVKDAIVDHFRDKVKRRPDVDTKNPHLEIHVMLKSGVASLYRNLSGESLHKRGYRPIQVKSPLNEATAAGLILLSGWDWTTGAIDPMCGGGTFLIEAAWIALRRAPGMMRRFAFERWPDFNRPEYERMKAEIRARERTDLAIRFAGSDRHAGAVALAQKAVKAALVSKWVTIEQKPIGEFEPTIDFSTVFVNPPWGQRLTGKDSEPAIEVEETTDPDGGVDDPDGDVLESWRALGKFLHTKCRGKTAFVLCGNPELPKLMGLKASRRIPVRTGPTDCRFLRYDVFKDEPPAAP